jgi:uncharacterized protein YciI
MYLMISTYLRPLDEVDEARPDHLRFMDELEATGVVVGAGRQDPPVGGVVLLDVASADEGRALLAGDPYVQRGLARYDAICWNPVRGALGRWTRPQR